MNIPIPVKLPVVDVVFEGVAANIEDLQALNLAKFLWQALKLVAVKI